MNENENRSVNKATDENTNTQNNNYEQADMPIVSEINDTVKKRGSNKKIIVGVIAAVIVVIAAAAVYASLAKPELLNIFKSDEEISLNNKEIILIQASRIKFSSPDEVAWLIDGENGGKLKEAEVDNINEGIEICAPDSNIYI